jgi:hypothetical protein
MNGLGSSRRPESCEDPNIEGTSKAITRADARPDSHDPLYLTWLALMEGRFEMIKPKTYSWVDLFKILLSKLVSQEGWSLEDWTFFNEALLRVSLQADKDKDFSQKYKSYLSFGKMINKSFNDVRTIQLPLKPNKKFLKKRSEKGQFVPSPNLWYSQGRKKFLKSPPTIVIKVRPSRFDRPTANPNERYIGVGYRDKGKARDKAVDGSPKWQDLCNDWRLRSSESDSTSFPSEKEDEEVES